MKAIILPIILTFITIWSIAMTTYGSLKELIRVMKKDFGFCVMIFVSTIMFFILFYIVFKL
jgi:hypothetical protein